MLLVIPNDLFAPSRSAKEMAYELHVRMIEVRFEQFNEDLKKNRPDLFILAMRESARTDKGDTIPNYAAYNRFGYIGAWQINIKYLPAYGVDYFTLEEFKEDPDLFPPELQLLVIEKMTERNMEYLEPYLKYVGKHYRGFPITEEGILFAAHLAGAGGTKNFFDSGHNPADAYGTTLTSYLDYRKHFHYLLN